MYFQVNFFTLLCFFLSFLSYEPLSVFFSSNTNRKQYMTDGREHTHRPTTTIISSYLERWVTHSPPPLTFRLSLSLSLSCLSRSLVNHFLVSG